MADLPKHLAAIEEHAIAEYTKFLRGKLKEVEQGLKGTTRGATLSFTYSIRERKDGDYDVTPTGRASVPYNGDTGKARIEQGQLTLL